MRVAALLTRPAGIMPAGRVRARLALLAVVVVAVWSPPAAEAAARPVLTREVTLRGSGSGWVGVRLTAPLRFAATGQPAVVKVSNAAAFAGVFLVREQRGAWPPGVGVVPLPKDGGLPYTSLFFGHERGTSDPDDNPMIYRRTLAPGSYRLYLLTRGKSPVTVTVRFPLASGRRTVAVPRNTAHADSTALSPGIPGTAVSPSHSHSATHSLARRGLLVNVAWWSGDLSARYTVGGCAYDGPVPDPSPAVPACPNGPGAVIDGDDVQSPHRKMSTGYVYVRPGRWLQKAYFVVGGSVRHGGVAHYWIDLGAGFPPEG